MNEKAEIQSKTEQFSKYLAKCNVQEFFGICKILKVELGNGAKTKEDFDMRPFDEVWSDLIEKFNSLARPQRRELTKILKQAVTADGKKEVQ